MQSQKKTWEQVGELFETLGKHLRDRAEDVGVEATAERDAIEKSIRNVTTALEEVLSSLGKVVRDPQLKKDVTHLVDSLRAAVQGTYTSATARVRRVVEPARRTTPARKPATTKAAHAPADRKPATAKPRKASSGTRV